MRMKNSIDAFLFYSNLNILHVEGKCLPAKQKLWCKFLSLKFKFDLLARFTLKKQQKIKIKSRKIPHLQYHV